MKLSSGARAVAVSILVCASTAVFTLTGRSAAAAVEKSNFVSVASLLRAPLVRLGDRAVPPPGAKAIGALAPGHLMRLAIAFEPRLPAALETYATAVNTPGSPSFAHFVTPTQFRERFGPSQATIASVQMALRAEGFTVSPPSRNGLIMPVSAPVSVVDRVLRITEDSFRRADGTLGWAATTAPMVQAPIARDITAILGLDDLLGPHSFLERPPRRAAGAAHSGVTMAPGLSRFSSGKQMTDGGPNACAAAASGASAGGGWTFNQLAAAYGVDGLYSHGALGQGETIALFELEPFETSDIGTFDSCYFGAATAAAMLQRLRVIKVDGGVPPGPGSGEAALDVEDISALAPRATIDVYEAPSSTIGTEYATDDIYNAIVNADTATVISTSWGLCEPALQIAAPGAQEVENEIFEEAAVQGQSVFAAAGDSGSNDCSTGATPAQPVLAVDDPASQPFVIGVGGTSLTSVTQPPVETVWNDGRSGGGGGGGISDTWPSPGWQANSGVQGVLNSYSGSSSYAFCAPAAGAPTVTAPPSPPLCREVPDVTIDANEDTGTSFYQSSSGGWGTIGGTSTAAPMWAAITADIASSDSCSGLQLNGQSHERDLGFIAPALYEAAAGAPPGRDFTDITRGTNDIFGLGKGFPATVGYDLASGLGSPVVTDAQPSNSPASVGTDTGLSASLCQLLTPSSARPVITGISPAYGPVSGGNTVVISGSGLSGSGLTVEAVSFGATRADGFATLANGSLSVTVPPAAPPAGAAGETSAPPGPVVVTVTIASPAGVQSTPPVPATSRYIYTAGGATSPTPSVSGIGPSGGPTAGGNVVVVYGSGFGGVGADVTSITFGGVRATRWRYLNDYEMQVTVPPRSRDTTCANGKGFDPSSTCQVEVVVANHYGDSPSSKILAPYAGSMTENNQGIVVPAAGTEIDPAATEYDYAAVPTVTAVQPQPYSETSSQPITVVGTGFCVLTLEWVNVGAPSESASSYGTFGALSPTRVSVSALLPNASSHTRFLPGGVSVLGLGGRSKALPFRYRA